MEFEPFQEAYRHVTGTLLEVVSRSESPDFICERSGGEYVGVELMKITRDPDSIFTKKIIYRNGQIEPDDAVCLIMHAIERKEVLRDKYYMKRIPETILVLQLFDGNLGLINHILEDIRKDFASHGFYEIWLADHSGQEAYGDIELFGLYPTEWWGYHQRPNPNRKPYG